MDDIPAELTGLRATGTVSREDYEGAVIPLLEEARCKGRRIRLLFYFGPEFEGLTAAAAWEDLKVGWRYLRLFERCAVVSDHVGKPDDIAHGIVYLASDEARFVTGSELVIDGGYTAA